MNLVWRRSTKCDSGLCVEVAFCDMGNCVEVAFSDDVLVRDSADKDGPRLTFGAEAWQRFMAGIRGGWYDR